VIIIKKYLCNKCQKVYIKKVAEHNNYECSACSGKLKHSIKRSNQIEGD